MGEMEVFSANFPVQWKTFKFFHSNFSSNVMILKFFAQTFYIWYWWMCEKILCNFVNLGLNYRGQDFFPRVGFLWTMKKNWKNLLLGCRSLNISHSSFHIWHYRCHEYRTNCVKIILISLVIALIITLIIEWTIFFPFSHALPKLGH